MTEASVSSPLMKALRETLPGCVVVKHRDASMIGLPDCSITYGGHVLWLEFKLFEWKKWMDDFKTNHDLGMELLRLATESAPTQRAMMDKLYQASASLYVIWIKKTSVLIVDPVRGSVICSPKTAGAVHNLAWTMRTVGYHTVPRTVTYRKPGGFYLVKSTQSQTDNY